MAHKRRDGQLSVVRNYHHIQNKVRTFDQKD